MDILCKLPILDTMDKEDALDMILHILDAFKSNNVLLTRSAIENICQRFELIYFHSTCSKALQTLVKESNLPVYPDDKILWYFLRMYDFHELDWTNFFIEMLHDKFFRHDVDPKAVLILQKIFAIDGLENGDVDNLWVYTNRLGFGLEKESTKNILGVHTQAVRKLYEAGATPSQIYETLLKWSENSETDTWMQLYEQNLEDSLKNEIREWIKMKIKNRVWDKNGKSNAYKYKCYRRD